MTGIKGLGLRNNQNSEEDELNRVHSSRPQGAANLQKAAIHDSIPEKSQRGDYSPVHVVQNDDINEYDDVNDEEIEQPDGRCACCVRFFRPCLVENNPMPDQPSFGFRMKHAFLCPPHGYIALGFTVLIGVCLLWGVAWSVLGQQALPGGNIFALIILFICSNLGGYICTKVKLPPLLGMLLMGVLLRNVPKINVGKDIDSNWSRTIRSAALVLILLRAGLGLDVQKLRKQLFPVTRLSLFPMTAEVTTVAVSSHFFFMFPWTWAFLLGFVHAAVSPAVVILGMLGLQDLGLGTNKGIPTLLMASGSLENVVAISGFSLALGITFAHGSLAMSIARCPMEIGIGFAYGILGGVILWYIPKRSHPQLGAYRFFLLFGSGLFAIFGFRAAGVAGAGALGCLIIAFIAGIGWKKRGWPDEPDPVPNILANMWTVFQPMLFGLVGSQVVLEFIQPKTIAYGTSVMAIGLIFRISVTFLSMFGANLRHREKLFICFAWLPKATVQAAIGSQALDMAIDKKSGPEDFERGLKILTMAVYIILVTAPLGALLVPLTAPKLLQPANKDDNESQMEEEEEDTESARLQSEEKPVIMQKRYTDEEQYEIPVQRSEAPSAVQRHTLHERQMPTNVRRSRENIIQELNVKLTSNTTSESSV